MRLALDHAWPCNQKQLARTYLHRPDFKGVTHGLDSIGCGWSLKALTCFGANPFPQTRALPLQRKFMPDPAIIDIGAWKTWQLAGCSAQLIDVRSASEFACGHLPGAINIPLEQIEFRTPDLDRARPIVLVCQAGTRARLAARLLQPEFPNLTILLPGTAAWIREGNPAVCCTVSRWALERQVRLVAGLLVIAGVSLGIAVSPWFLIIAALVGCGLTFAGATNLCPMGELLARLPHNRLRPSLRGSYDTDSSPAQGLSCPCEQQKQA
ncbi:rhodanese-like domain-containing protein [Acidobacteria bacterium AB60]|nr:rhodanese-like domain-containing protein [Acidobacteria bacterium AB60]